MLRIDENNNIYLTKGDTALIDITLYYDSEPYEMRAGDKLLFAMKRNVKFNYTVLSREYTRPQIELFQADTNALSFGEYDYSITYIHNDGAIDTFLTGKFYITETSEGSAAE